MQVRRVHGAGSHPAQNPYEILRQVQAFTEAGTGECLVQQDQAIASDLLEDLSEPHGFLAKTPRLRVWRFLERKMSEEVIQRADDRLRPGHAQAKLRQDVNNAHALHVGGLAAAIGSGQDEDVPVWSEADIVLYNSGPSLLPHPGMFEREMHIVGVLHLAPALLGGGDLRSAHWQAQLLEALKKAHGAQVKEQTLSQVREQLLMQARILLQLTCDRDGGLFQYACQV